jgi:hypothetical protein
VGRTVAAGAVVDILPVKIKSFVKRRNRGVAALMEFLYI